MIALAGILEKVSDYANVTKNPDELSEHARRALGAQIAKPYQADNGRLQAIFRLREPPKKTAETVLVVEPIPGDWRIVSSSAPHQKTSSSTASWAIRVPAEGSATLTYRVRVTY